MAKANDYTLRPMFISSPSTRLHILLCHPCYEQINKLAPQTYGDHLIRSLLCMIMGIYSMYWQKCQVNFCCYTANAGQCRVEKNLIILIEVAWP